MRRRGRAGTRKPLGQDGFMGLVLALIGLAMSAIDFFSLTERCERAAQCFKDSLKARKERVDVMVDSSLRFVGYLVAVALIAALLLVLGVYFIRGGVALAIYSIAVLAGCFVAMNAQLFLGIAVGVFHLLSLPRKGIVGSLGLLLALTGVLIEMF